MNWFGDLLRRKRKERGLTLEAVACRLGTFKGYICGIERGLVGPPSPEMTRMLAILYGLDDKGLILLGYVEKAPESIQTELRQRLYPEGPPAITERVWTETLPEPEPRPKPQPKAKIPPPPIDPLMVGRCWTGDDLSLPFIVGEPRRPSWRRRAKQRRTPRTTTEQDRRTEHEQADVETVRAG